MSGLYTTRICLEMAVDYLGMRKDSETNLLLDLSPVIHKSSGLVGLTSNE